MGGEAGTEVGCQGRTFRSKAMMLNVAPAEGEEPVQPSLENVQNGSYPITRPLLCYTVGEPTGTLKEYLDWIKAPEAQKIVLAQGYVPLSSSAAE